MAASILRSGEMSSDQARIQALEKTPERIRGGLKTAAAAAFRICEEDLYV